MQLKVPSSGGRPISEIKQQAEKVVEGYANRFETELGDNLRQLRIYTQQYLAGPCQDTLRDIFNIVHDMRGLGKQFDYPYITIIGGQICDYLDSLHEGELPRNDVMNLMLYAFSTVEKKKVKGQGNEQLEEMVVLLGKMVSKVSS